MLDPRLLLENLPLFKGLSWKRLGTIACTGKKVYFEAADNLIVKDDAGDTAFLILTGTAKCLHFPGAPAASGSIGPGALIGETAMLVDTVHSFTVQAEERLRALALHREALKQAMELDPVIAQQISENLLARLQSIANELRQVDVLLAKAESPQPREQLSNRRPSEGKPAPPGAPAELERQWCLVA
jgi:CRP-like cAMP-binding protein